MEITPRWRKALVGLGVGRVLLGIVAIPLVPMLYEDHFLLLVLLRPTKEVFLAGGFLARRGEVNVAMILVAAIPLAIFGVWLFFVLGRIYAGGIKKKSLSGLTGRLLDADRIKRFEDALDDRGPKLIFLGRLAVLSSAAVAAAAGAAGLEPRRFLPFDLAGGLLSIGYTIAAGYVLGKAGPWITVVGVITFMGFAYLLGRSLKRS